MESSEVTWRKGRLHLDSKQFPSKCAGSFLRPISRLSKTVPWDTHFPLCPRSKLSSQTAVVTGGEVGQAQGRLG